MNGTQSDNKLAGRSPRLIGFLIVFFAVMLFYVYRLFTIQILNGDYYLDLADENRISIVQEQTKRGIIYDRNGVVLARNTGTYDITITPSDLPEDDGDTQEVYRKLSQLIDVPVNNGEINDETVRLYSECGTDFGISQIVYIASSLSPYTATGIRCDVSKELAMVVQEKAAEMPGVGVRVNSIREYPTGYSTAEIVGFLGPIPEMIQDEMREKGFLIESDQYGYAGVESSLQDILSGKNGRRVVEVDVGGLQTRDLEPPKDPVPGYNIKLTIDVRLQNVMRAAMIDTMDFYNRVSVTGIITEDAAGIAMNPKTGEILAMVSEPSYENNRMTRYIPAYYYQQLSVDQSKPLMNHATQVAQPPGSVFKIVTGIGAMNEKVVAPDYMINDPGHIYMEQKYSPNDPGSVQEYVCHLRTGHGMVDYQHALAWSCNIYFNKVGGGYGTEVPEGLGIDRLGQYARALGYDQYSGVELDGEEDGLIPTTTWKRVNQGEAWATGDTYLASMGQGYITATPIQVLGSFVTVANSGIHMKPTLIEEILDERGNVVLPFTPQMYWDITKDPRIMIYDENGAETEEYKTVEPWVIEETRKGLRRVPQPGGTAAEAFEGDTHESSAKTGTAEYCDDIANAKGMCQFGSWPAHAWTVAYAPYNDPEIAVVVFVYNGKEGAYLAAYPVRRVIDNYFLLKEYDAERDGTNQ